MILSDRLEWGAHVEHLHHKLYLFVILNRAGVEYCDILRIFTSMIRQGRCHRSGWSAQNRTTFLAKKTQKQTHQTNPRIIFQLAWNSCRSGGCLRVNQTTWKVVAPKPVRSVLEYAWHVWHTSITKGQPDRLQSTQKRALRILYPELSYKQTMAQSGMQTMRQRREIIARKFFI